MTDLYDVIIIGGGVVGGAAQMYAGRMGLKSLMIGDILGGTIITTDIVENYPGFKRLTGQELANNILEHAKEYDGDIEQDRVSKVEKDGNNFKVTTNDKTFKGKTVVFATGTKHRKLNVPGAKELENKGINFCALCDAFFFKDKVVAVVGGADSALKEALLLSEHASKVFLIARGPALKGEPINHARVEKNEKIEVLLNTNVIEVLGDKTVTGIKLDTPHKGSDTLELSGAFIAIGYIPQTGIAEELGVELDGKKQIKVDRDAKTNLPGIFAAGDCIDSKFKQAIVGVGEAVVAIYSAYIYINSK